jgi:membrane peptidoglycan carboxypeptidase
LQSLNVPFVRITRWCGFSNTAERLRRSGMELPKDLPPAFVLGAVETTPLALARAYTVFGSLGRAFRPRPYEKIFLPGGRLLVRHQTTPTKVVEPATAFLIRDLLEDSVRHGTSAAAALENHTAFGKTGTSSGARDAWFAGGAGSVVAVVWVGLDDNEPLRLSGAAAAAPIWKAFMEQAVPLRPTGDHGRPAKIVEHWIETDTGLLVPRQRGGAELDLFRKGATPPKRRLLKRDEPVPKIE